VVENDLLTLEARRTTRPRGSERRRVLLLSAGLFVAGVGPLWLVLAIMNDIGPVLRILGGLIGLVCLHQACVQLGRGLWGPQFDAGLWLCIAWLALLVLAAVLADLLPLAEHQNASVTIGSPGNQGPDLFSRHPLGTNNLSLDLLARSIYGARVSLLTTLMAVMISLIIGVTVGMFAGYFRGAADATLGVFTDSALAIPPLILLLAIVTVFGVTYTVGDAILKTGVALAIVSVPTVIRLARANTLVLVEREYIYAARAMGAKHPRILARELVPNVIVPMVSYGLVIIAVLIVAEGSLAFLGLGLQQPKPTWGNMMAEGGLTELRRHPHIPLVPGVIMFLTVYSFNRVGERARRSWDRREARI
jgi:peptide/nickel transport system permease protein